ncbi:MAG: ferritin-like domain-containing protein, partial [Bacteriovoracia bacterium]
MEEQLTKFMIEKEESMMNMYKELAQQTNDEGLKSIFEMMVEEEASHVELAKRIDQAINEDLKTEVINKSKDIFEKTERRKESFDFSDEQKVTYAKIRDMERDSEEFYRKKAAEAENPKVRTMLKKMAAIEHSHFILMDNIYEFVNRPSEW